MEGFRVGVLDYANTHSISPYEVLKNDDVRRKIVAQSYPSKEVYEEVAEKHIVSLNEAFSKLEGLGNMPLGLMLPMVVPSLLDVKSEELERFGVDLARVGNIAQTYMKDIELFGKGMLLEYTKMSVDNRKKMAEYFD